MIVDLSEIVWTFLFSLPIHFVWTSCQFPVKLTRIFPCLKQQRLHTIPPFIKQRYLLENSVTKIDDLTFRNDVRCPFLGNYGWQIWQKTNSCVGNRVLILVWHPHVSFAIIRMDFGITFFRRHIYWCSATGMFVS